MHAAFLHVDAAVKTILSGTETLSSGKVLFAPSRGADVPAMTRWAARQKKDVSGLTTPEGDNTIIVRHEHEESV